MDKLFLLDAYALIYRAYYAFIKSPRINSKGFNTSAVLGFVNTLEEVLKKENQDFQSELNRIQSLYDDLQIQYNSVVTSRRWTIPTKIINFFRRSK